MKFRSWIVTILIPAISIISIACSKKETPFQKNAESGNAEAQNRLDQMYNKGNEISKNTSKGVTVKKEEVQKKPISQNSNNGGYKNAKWGMNPIEVGKSLNLKLLDNNEWHSSNEGLFEGNFGQVFSKLLDLPEDSFGSYKWYNKSNLPTDKFTYYHTEDDDDVIFYEKKFVGYNFQVDAINYDTYLKKIISEKGDPKESFSLNFLNDGNASPSFSATFFVNIWEIEPTLTLLIKEESVQPEVGMAFTKVRLYYLSKEFLNKLSGDIESNKAKKERGKQEMQNKTKEEDIRKFD